MNLLTFVILNLSIISPTLNLLIAQQQVSQIDNGGCTVTYLDENLQPIQTNSINNLQPQQQFQQYQQDINSLWASPGPTIASVGLECQYIKTEQLHDQFNRFKPSGLKIVSLAVRDSNLTTLSNLPQGTHELKKLIISNTSIDLEVLKEGSESLNQLTLLEIANEKISNIPQNFFQEMQSLKELRLENDEIASLDGDAFHNLDDSLEILNLHRNRFNRFPMAVKNLAQLTILNLTDNDIVIDTQDNDLPEKLELLLNLRELAMNRINCTCEFSSSPFFEWIARTHIYGVRCFAPEKLKSQEVIVFERDEFCPRGGSGSLKYNNQYNNLYLLLLCLSISSLSLIYLMMPSNYIN